MQNSELTIRFNLDCCRWGQRVHHGTFNSEFNPLSNKRTHTDPDCQLLTQGHRWVRVGTAVGVNIDVQPWCISSIAVF